MDAVAKLKEIAAHDLGGSPDDYDIGNETVFRRGNPSRRLTYAAAATRAIQLGGKFCGEEVAEDLNPMTKGAVRGLAGTGLIGAAKDTLERQGMVPALAAGFIRIELDLETGKFEILDYLGVADCGTVMHPQGLAAQIRSGAVMGFGLASLERQVYDPHYGPAALDRPVPGQAAVLSGRAHADGYGCGGPAGPAEPDGHEGDRRAADGLRRRRPAVRDFGRAGWPLFQPDAGATRHDRERGGRAAAVPQALASQHRLRNLMANDMMPHFELFQPADLETAFELLDRWGDRGWALAGGHDSLGWFKERGQAARRGDSTSRAFRSSRGSAKSAPAWRSEP